MWKDDCLSVVDAFTDEQSIIIVVSYDNELIVLQKKHLFLLLYSSISCSGELCALMHYRSCVFVHVWFCR